MSINKRSTITFYAIAALLMLCLFSAAAHCESTEYVVKFVKQNQEPVEGVQIFGNHNFQQIFSDTAGEATFDVRDLERNGSSEALNILFAKPGFKLDPPELEINPESCPNRTCKVLATPSTTEESAVVRLYFVNSLNRPIPGVLASLSSSSSVCGKGTDNYGAVYFSTTRKQNCNDGDTDPLNDSNKVMLLPALGLQCTLSSLISAVCPKQVFTSIASVISCSSLPNKVVTGYTVKAQVKNGLALANLNLKVIPQNSNYSSFNVVTDSSGSVLIPFNLIGTGNYPVARIIPIGRYHFFPNEIRASAESCIKGTCLIHAGESLIAQKIQTHSIQTPNNLPVTGVNVEVTAPGICNTGRDLFSDKDGKVTFPIRESTGCTQNEKYKVLPRLNACQFKFNNNTAPFLFCANDSENPIISADCNQVNTIQKISGYVFDPYGQPLEAVEIKNNGQLLTRTRADGSYAVSATNGEELSLSASFDPLLFDPANIKITGIDKDKKLNFMALTAEGGMPVRGGDSCAIADVYTINGTVFDLNGQRLANVTILNNHEQVDTSDENGNYQFSVAAYTDVWVTADHDNLLFNPAGYAFPVIACDKPQTNFQVTQIPSYIQAGFIRDQDNNPIPEFELSVVTNGNSSLVFTDSTGYYRIVLEEDANFTIEPQDPRYGDCTPTSRSEVSDRDRYNLDFNCTRDECADSNKLSPGVCGCNTPDIDTDGDDTMDCLDQCPNDPNKVSPGICGCGNSDKDTDGDGTPDYFEQCDEDPTKTEPGECGCGIADVDSDGDGVLDCNDKCFNDAAKIIPGACGCGNLETDSDADGTPDCVDFCPDDEKKNEPLQCGCGKLETDDDADGKSNCIDLCPQDPKKSKPGVCGCGVSDDDTDGDGVLFCNDECPEDYNKTQPGACGCGIRDIDTDNDGKLDCKEECPEDPYKVFKGICGCGVADTDIDGDGALDCKDVCPKDSNKKDSEGVCGCGIADTDSDNDGTPDCIDSCPSDALKTELGECGCGKKDLDSDSDGVANCVDECPWDPLKSESGICGCGTLDNDTDGDKTLDCQDECPNDPNKITPGVYGCGNSDKDTDGDGAPDFIESCDLDPDKIAPGTCGCGTPDKDSDGDGGLDCIDACPNDSNKKLDQGLCGCGVPDTDSDNDGIPNCQDECPNDQLKVEVGQCGCGVADSDSDKDGVADCKDACPKDSNKKDSQGVCGCGIADTDLDNDGTPDCKDSCKNDAGKIVPGVCGCGYSDADTDGDGVPDCRDECPKDNLKFSPGACGCGFKDTDTDGDSTPNCIDLCPEDPFKIARGQCGCGATDFDLNFNDVADCNEKPMLLKPLCKEKGDAPEIQVPICHTDEHTGKKEEIKVPMSTLQHHLDHGDTLGSCPISDPPVNPPSSKKIQICHIPPGNKKNAHTIEISESAWKAHLGHGDTLGPCPKDFSTTASIRWEVSNPNTVGYDANLEVLASTPAQVMQFSIAKNSSQIITTKQLEGYNVAVLKSGFMVHATKIHDLQDCPAPKAPVTIAPLCIDTLHEENQPLKWKVKNITGQKITGILGVLDANPLQYQTLSLEAGQETIVTTQKISGENKLALYVNGVEQATSSHTLSVCQKPDVLIGGDLKGINGRPLSSKILKMLEGQDIWIELRDNKAKAKQIINFEEDFSWKAKVPQGANVRAVLKNNGSLDIISVPRVFREVISSSTMGLHFAIRARTKFSNQSSNRRLNVN